MITRRVHRSGPRGMTLVEVLASLGILAVSVVGLVAGILVAMGANTLSAKRTQMLEFAQGRIERLVTRNRSTLCGAGTGLSTYSASPLCASMVIAGAFDPTAAPGTGGWVADTLDATNNGTNNGAPAGDGDDTLLGPVAVFGDNNVIDTAKTVAFRDYFITNSLTCADNTHIYNVTGGGTIGPVSKDGTIICREIHSEAADVGTNPVVPMLHIWVRVIRGGWGTNSFAGAYQNGSVTLDRLVYRPTNAAQ